MYKLRGLLVLSLLAWFGSSLAAPGAEKKLSSLSEARALSDKAMADAIAGKYRAAFNRFRPYWPLTSKEIDLAIKNIEKGISVFNKRFGKPIGYSYVGKKRASNFLVRYLYVARYQHGLVRWQFTYYKARNRWQVLGVTFDDNYEELLR